MPDRTVAIGDVHGCSAALAALLDLIDPGPDDTVVTLGDYIDRGPDSSGVLDQLIALGERCRLVPLKGNHEEMFLASRASYASLHFWLACGGAATLESYGSGARVSDVPPDHVAFMHKCRDFYETDTHIFVHANYRPGVPMSKQPAEALRWEFLDPARAAPHQSGKTVVAGHTPQKSGDVLDLTFVKGIDTACYSGGWLTALEVGSDRVWQVDERGRPRNPRDG